MKIALIGASGNIGSRILDEALSRGHTVTGIIRNTSKMQMQNSLLKIASADLFNSTEICRIIKGHDVLISAFSPGFENPEVLVEATKSLLAAAKNAGVKRVIAVGGAGSLEVAPNTKLYDTPEFPADWKSIAKAHHQALEIYQQEKDLDWTNVSPAALIEPGSKTGKFRLAENSLIIDSTGNSKISMEDFAVAILDEIESPKFIKKRFTVGY